MPMLVMLDGGYAFDATVQLSQYLQRDREVGKYIIVGVSYEVDFGKPLAVERTRDFTPPVDASGSITREQTAYYRFLRDRLLPRLQQRYQVDPTRRVLWGYSLSGSFAAWLDYHDPTLFDHHILASANLMEFGILQKLFAGQIFSSRQETPRKVFISYDAREIPDPTLIESGRKLLANGAMFPGHEIRLSITHGESHASSWFVSLPASLKFIFGGMP
jgi:predicted alpha/beta superfamily hydrolase